MFRRLAEATTRAIALTVDDKPVSARDGDTVAAALLAAGIGHTRTTPVSGAPRAPYCMMGVCFECLVSIKLFPYLTKSSVETKEFTAPAFCFPWISKPGPLSLGAVKLFGGKGMTEAQWLACNEPEVMRISSAVQEMSAVRLSFAARNSRSGR